MNVLSNIRDNHISSNHLFKKGHHHWVTQDTRINVFNVQLEMVFVLEFKPCVHGINTKINADEDYKDNEVEDLLDL